jgi:hypothetical protein
MVMNAKTNFDGKSVEFIVRVVDGRVVIDRNGGNLYGRGGNLGVVWKVSEADAEAGLRFSLAFREFAEPQGEGSAAPASPMHENAPDISNVKAYTDVLRKLPPGFTQFACKYTVTVNRPGVAPLDPVIIVDR